MARKRFKPEQIIFKRVERVWRQDELKVPRRRQPKRGRLIASLLQQAGDED